MAAIASRQKMKTLGTIILILTPILSFGQENNTSDFLDKVSNHDFSNLWTLTEFTDNDKDRIIRQEPLGYIGENYQRFFIHFISAIQNPKNKLEYFIYGKTKVKDNICSFQGIVKITQAKTYNKRDVQSVKQGFIKGQYEFFEDGDKNGTGILKGVFQTDFYVDEKGKLQYDAMSFISDEYCNNQFEGTWTSYKSGQSKKCNWGDFRIPDSGDLDVGAGEFGPAQKYEENGWKNYYLAVVYSPDKPEAQEAKKKENEKWWTNE